MPGETKFGVVLPHFGRHCDVEFLLDTAKGAETLGFDSLWVRDHVFIPPENREHGGIVERRFLEPLETLSALSTVTEEVTLATGITMPVRHPLKLSQNLGTLSYLAGGRVLCTLGAGAHRGEFEALDIPFEERGQIVRETFEILRRTFAEEDVSFSGEQFEFENVTIDPQPVEELPIWYGGLSRIAVKRAFFRGDGWLASRMPLPKFHELMDLRDELEREHDRQIDVGDQVLVSVDEDAEAARDRFDTEAFLHEANTMWPDDAPYESEADIEGYYVAGDPEDCVEQLQVLVDRGVDHFAFDLRNSFDRMDESLELLADEVIPNID